MLKTGLKSHQNLHSAAGCCCLLSSSFDDCMRHGQNFMGFHYPEATITTYFKGPINLALGPPSGFFQAASNQKGGVISTLENTFCVFW